MAQCTEILSARFINGRYDNLISEIPEPWDGLWTWLKRKKSARDEVYDNITGESSSQVKRLDYHGILKHYREHGPRKTYLMQPSSVKLSTGETAEYIYVVPKYKLERAHENALDMEAMLKLGQAETRDAIQNVCADPDEGTYDIFRRMFSS